MTHVLKKVASEGHAQPEEIDILDSELRIIERFVLHETGLFLLGCIVLLFPHLDAD